MTDLVARLRGLRRMLQIWKPQTGFRATNLSFTPADIIFGKRIAVMIRQVPDHCQNAHKVVELVSREALADRQFRAWLSQTANGRLREIIEFTYFQVPPRQNTAAE